MKQDLERTQKARVYVRKHYSSTTNRDLIIDVSKKFGYTKAGAKSLIYKWTRDLESPPKARKKVETNFKGPELIKKLIARAEAVAGIAQKENLISRNAMQEVTLGGKFQGAQKAVAGQADIVSYDDKGLMVGDYKFSSQGGEKIEAERILQASIYMALYEEELMKELAVLEDAEKNGTLTPEQE